MYVSLGQFNIPIAWLAFIIAIFYSDFRSRKLDAATNKSLEQLVFTYLIVWKGSYMLFSWTDFLQAPLSLVYFDGGRSGHLLALAVIAGMLYLKRQTLVWEAVWVYWARVVASYHIVSFGFQEQWLLAGVFLVVLLATERYQHWVLFAQLLLLVWLHGFFNSLTLVHLLTLLTVFFKTRQVQYMAIAGIASLVALTLSDLEQTTEAVARGAIQLSTTTGELYRLAEQDQQLTVVNFFATWCPPCQAEMPHLQSFAENLPPGVALIGINLTARDDGEQALTDFTERYRVTYPILLDEIDAVGTAFQVISIPTTVLLNADGEELARIVGPVSEDGLRQLIKKYQ